MKKILSMIFSLLLLLGCDSKEQNGKTLLMPFDAFGPAAMSEPLLGQSWWQWQTHGDPRPHAYKIKVIVYKELNLDEVKQRYPVSETKLNDYRYVDYESVIKYLNQHIKENIIPNTTQKLQSTKKKVIHHFQ